MDFAADALARGRTDTAARALALQLRQVEATRSEFSGETGKIATSFSALDVDASDLGERGRRLFGRGEDADGSFLEAIGRKLSVARACVEEGLKARASVDEAKSAFAAEMSELRTRTASLSEIADDVGMIGTNASLRSTRLGEAGRGVTVIAAELRDFGREIRATIAELSKGLERVLAYVDRFSAAQRELDIMRLTELGRRMAAAVDTFGDCGRRMSETLGALGAQADRAREALVPAAQALSAHGALGLELEAAADVIGEFADVIGEFAGAIGGGGVAAADIDRVLDETLRPTYSMAAERRVHDQFAGRAPAAVEEEAPAEADAFML
jgi:methyl-accepting chemotaxis protein